MATFAHCNQIDVSSMKRIALFVMAAAVSLLAGCSKNTPKDVVKTYFSALQSKDYDKVADCVYLSETEGDPAAQKKDLSGWIKMCLEPLGGLKSYEITRDSVCNDSLALVFASYEYGNGDKDASQIELVMQDGKWKINLMNK
jgi:hypothetical protein